MHCVVAGSGITGLTAALLLARQGHDVTMVEAGPRVAPLLRGFWREGLYFDTGFHCGGGLHAGGVLRRWLRALGLEKHLRQITTSRTEVFHFADGKVFQLPAGQAAVTEAVERQFPGAGPAMKAFLHHMDTELGHSPYLNPSVWSEPSFALHSVGSVAQYAASVGFPPHLRAMLGTRCLLYGVRPEESSLEEYSLVAGPYFQSSGSWQGGGLALVEALLTGLGELGVTVRCNAAVAGIEADKAQGVRGVVLGDGSCLACERCFFTGHPSQLEGLIPKGLMRPAYLHRINELPETRSAMLLFAETRDCLNENESIYLLPEPSAEELFPGVESAHPSVYLFCDRPQPDGRKAVMAVALMDDKDLPGGDPHPRPKSYVEWKRESTARLQAYIEKRLPELAGRWRILDAASPLTMRRWVYGATGSLYGVQHHLDAMPMLPVTRLPGLFLAGQNILLPGVLGGMVSAALAVGFSFGHDNVLKEFRECAESE